MIAGGTRGAALGHRGAGARGARAKPAGAAARTRLAGSTARGARAAGSALALAGARRPRTPATGVLARAIAVATVAARLALHRSGRTHAFSRAGRPLAPLACVGADAVLCSAQTAGLHVHRARQTRPRFDAAVSAGALHAKAAAGTGRAGTTSQPGAAARATRVAIAREAGRARVARTTGLSVPTACRADTVAAHQDPFARRGRIAAGAAFEPTPGFRVEARDRVGACVDRRVGPRGIAHRAVGSPRGDHPITRRAAQQHEDDGKTLQHGTHTS